MSAEKIKELQSKVYAAIEELRKTALETNTPASINIDWRTYEVFLPDFEDEDMVEYLQGEYGKEAGDWISSSERC